MRKIILFIVLIIIVQTSCIVQDKYKESDIFSEYETENGFGVFHIPTVLFKIVFSLSDNSELDANLMDKVDVVKVMFFEQSDNTIGIDDLKTSVNEKIKKFNYNLLTKIAQEDNDVSIYIIDQQDIIREVLIVIVSDKEYVGVNVVGELTKEDVMKIYKAVDVDNLRNMNN